MTNKINIPLEEDLNLLREYGRAFAFLNQVDFLLENYIHFVGGLNKANSKLAKKVLTGKTFGQKIKMLDETYINGDIIKNLDKLNEKRNILAHGALFGVVDPTAKTISAQEHQIGHNGKRYKLDIAFTEEIINQAKEALIKILDEFKSRGFKFIS